MPPILYMIDLSPPCRSVMMLAKAIEVDIEYKFLDLINFEHKKPEFMKLNPQHTVPVLDDDGLIISDSHAINCYLVSKYAKDDKMYPKDLAKRSQVDQRLHFDNGTAFALLRSIVMPIYRDGQVVTPKEKVVALFETYDFIEKFLEGKKWICGEDLTIADISLITTVTSVEYFGKIDEPNYPNLTKWLKRAKSLPYYNENSVGLKKYHTFLTEFIARNKNTQQS